MFRILILIFLFFFKTSWLFADTINDIKVKGNNRVSSETIINFSGITIGQDISAKQLNDSLKELYQTNFFKDIQFDISNETLLNLIKLYLFMFNAIKKGEIIHPFCI